MTFSVDAGRKLPAGVTAQIKFRNLVGQRYVSLGQGSAATRTRCCGPADSIPLEHTQGALDLTELFNGFKPLFRALSPDDVNKLSFEIIQVLQGEGGTVDSLLAHTASLTTAIADKDKVIGKLITTSTACSPRSTRTATSSPPGGPAAAAGQRAGRGPQADRRRDRRAVRARDRPRAGCSSRAARR